MVPDDESTPPANNGFATPDFEEQILFSQQRGVSEPQQEAKPEHHTAPRTVDLTNYAKMARNVRADIIAMVKTANGIPQEPNEKMDAAILSGKVVPRDEKIARRVEELRKFYEGINKFGELQHEVNKSEESREKWFNVVDNICEALYKTERKIQFRDDNKDKDKDKGKNKRQSSGKGWKVLEVLADTTDFLFSSDIEKPGIIPGLARLITRPEDKIIEAALLKQKVDERARALGYNEKGERVRKEEKKTGKEQKKPNLEEIREEAVKAASKLGRDDGVPDAPKRVDRRGTEREV